MKVTYTRSMQYRVLEKIRQLPENVILREDINDLGSARQVSRALKTLVKEGVLFKLGYGVYSKLERSPLFDQPFLKAGFALVIKEALNKLGVVWEPGQAEQAYNAGLTTQVPVNASIKIKSRFNRKLAYKNMKLNIE